MINEIFSIRQLQYEIKFSGVLHKMFRSQLKKDI